LDVNVTDEQGITALHWSSINGHLEFTRRLIQLGAKVDQRGGELQGTPLMWASRNGHLSIVHLLLLNGSDPSLKDGQSFNTLQLAVHSSSPFLVCYLLFTLLDSDYLDILDSTDGEGHTSLQWAAYQGDAISVELLLKRSTSTSVNQPDHQGLTALHWAITKGNSSCIKKILQHGGDLNIKDRQGKTAKDLARELKGLESLKRALRDLNRDEESGKVLDLPIKSEKNQQRVIFGLLIFGMGFIAKSLEFFNFHFNGWIGLLMFGVECYGLHYLVTRVVLRVTNRVDQSEKITKSNYLMSIIASSLTWVGWIWLTRNLTSTTTSNNGLTNFLFGLCFSTCCINFYKSITMDPGRVSKPRNDLELKQTIENLVEQGKFNGMNFCLTCLVKRPMRSKHSYATGNCIGRFDHYCPWVWNDGKYTSLLSLPFSLTQNEH
jgi:palmitoyltransferase